MLFLLVTALLKWAFLVLGFVMPLATLLTWAERRQSALSQDRLGPWRAQVTVAGVPLRIAGLLHPIADAMKMLFKEPFTPGSANKTLHGIAPLVGYVTALVVLAVIPFGPDIPTSVLPFVSAETIAKYPVVPLQVVRLDAGVLLVFAFGSLGVYGVALAGWASNNRFALLGGIRASAQAISYEVALGLTIVGILLAFGSTETSAIVAAQNSQNGLWGLPLWGIIIQPLGALLFFIASVAETKRTPFDVPEGESEIIGYFVEYSSMGFGMFMLGEFVEIVVLSAVFTTLFLGGWDLPWIMGDNEIWLGVTSLTPESIGLGWFHVAHMLLGVIVWSAKVVFLCLLQLQIRWSLPRFRYDQVMNLGWKMLLPLALVNIVVSVGL
ncbi:MAG: NADH-quinone oxidoreductase subunit H, partial [Clostridia bacterium]|nr:NADH-quinone oxidoreductase subunit H [Deltaproteobacteria bacterium]